MIKSVDFTPRTSIEGDLRLTPQEGQSNDAYLADLKAFQDVYCIACGLNCISKLEIPEGICNIPQEIVQTTSQQPNSEKDQLAKPVKGVIKKRSTIFSLGNLFQFQAACSDYQPVIQVK